MDSDGMDSDGVDSDGMESDELSDGCGINFAGNNGSIVAENAERLA